MQATNTNKDHAMKILRTAQGIAATRKQKAEERALFLSGKLRIDWSQTRGGYAIYVRGRMEGQLFESHDEACEWLSETHGIETINPACAKP